MKKTFLFACSLLLGSMSLAQSITGVSPSSGEQGTATLPITISGSGTNFSNATSTVFEISQGSNTLQVLSVNNVQPESINANIQITSSNPLGAYTVRAWDATQGDMLELSSGFFVIPSSNPTTLQYTTPQVVAETQMLPITITMDNANFSQATNSQIYLSVGTNTVVTPEPGTTVILNDNTIRAMFDFNMVGASAGTFINAHCYNSIDGAFDDPNAIEVTTGVDIQGDIDYAGAYNGVVELYQLNTGVTPNTYSLVQSQPVQGNGFLFSPVAEQESYLIRSVPIGMSDVVATYYVNNIDWQSATAVNPTGPFYLLPNDIVPFPSLLVNVLGITVNGTLGYGPNGFNKANTVFAEGVEVFLKDTDNNTFAQTVTDANGQYAFTEVPDGNYEIVIDLPGYNQVSTYSFAVSGGNVPDLDFLIDNHEIFTSGFMGTPKLTMSALEVYPNPALDEMTIKFPEGNQDYNVEIFNALGAVVWSKRVSSNSSALVTEDVSTLNSGVYIVKVQGGGRIAESLLIKK